MRLSLSLSPCMVCTSAQVVQRKRGPSVVRHIPRGKEGPSSYAKEEEGPDDMNGQPPYTGPALYCRSGGGGGGGRCRVGLKERRRNSSGYESNPADKPPCS